MHDERGVKDFNSSVEIHVEKHRPTNEIANQNRAFLLFAQLPVQNHSRPIKLKRNSLAAKTSTGKPVSTSEVGARV